MIDTTSLKEQFTNLLFSTGRKGSEKVINELEQLGFFQAPASSSFHLNEPGGLVLHSLNVCAAARSIYAMACAMNPSRLANLSENSIIIASLLHDVCKAEIYKPTTKRKKLPSGEWVDEPGYVADYSVLPVGHGEKSVIRLLQWGFELNDEEIVAIRWHMCAWDLNFNSNEQRSSISIAGDRFPLLTILQTADMFSSKILE